MIRAPVPPTPVPPTPVPPTPVPPTPAAPDWVAAPVSAAATEAGDLAEEDFEELRWFRAEQRARHRRLLRGLWLLGAGLVIGGVAVASLGHSAVGAGTLAVLGALTWARAALSAFTDYDTRDRGAFDAARQQLEAEMERKVGCRTLEVGMLGR